jgi:NADH-quinone oxidoreductase subunit H
VAGYQTEYSGLKFGMFYVGDFLHAFTVSILTATLFLGGWRGPWADKSAILGIAYLFAKTFVVYFFVVVFRISMPRLRIDQMLNFNWKFLTPLALALLMITAVVEKALLTWLPTLDISIGWATVIRTLVHLMVNLLVGLGALALLRRNPRPKPKRVAEPRPVATAPKSPAA